MELLKKLSEAYGVSGDEGGICALIRDEVKDFADDIYTDVMGNLIVHKRGEGKKVMYIAHTDEIGFTATHIDDNGFIRFGFVGNPDGHFLPFRRVIFKNGTVGTLAYEKNVSEIKDVNSSNMYIDIGAKDKREAENSVSVGDTACVLQPFADFGAAVSGKALGGRIGVYVLINALKSIKNNKNDLYFVFSSQKEVGQRGAKTAAFSIEPDYAVAIDFCETGDTPNCPVSDISLGGGAAIKVKDASVIANKSVREALVLCAEKNNIPYQLEVSDNASTDAGAVHLTKSGIKTGAVGIPVRYAKTPCETAYKCDIESAVRLFENLCFE